MSQNFAKRLYHKWIIDSFHRIWFHDPNTWLKNTFLGFGVQQFPLDLWLYQELVYKLKPRFIVQTGVCEGGSILYFAHLLDLVGSAPDALVVGVDIKLTPSARRLAHPRVKLLEGSSVDPAILDKVKQLIDPVGPILVILDSDHSLDHVRAEMRAYGSMVPIGSYMVVEDTNINGHPVLSSFGPGPYEALNEYLQTNDDFEQDEAFWSRNLLSFHQHGWLRRIK